MRVLLLTDWTHEEGGVERYLSLLADGLRAAGDDVRLVTSAEGPGARVADYAVRCGGGLASQGVLQHGNPFAFVGVRRAVRDFRPHVAHVSMFELRLSPIVFSALEGVPSIANVTSYKPFCPTTHRLLPDDRLCASRTGLVCARSGCVSWARLTREIPRYAFISHALRRAAAIVVASTWMRDVLAREALVAEVTGRPALQPPASFRRAPTDEPLFAFVGRLSREKGADVLVRAMASLKRDGIGARLVVAGVGPERATLQALAADLGLSDVVSFPGALDPGAIDDLLAEAWACVVPSRWAEPFGNVALDAVTRRVPVVATAVGGLPEIVQHGVTGLLVENGQAPAMAEALKRVVDEAFPGYSLPESAIRRLRAESSLEVHVARMRRLFERVGS